MYQPKTISKKDLVDNGMYPVFGANGLIGRYDKYNHEEPQLMVTCRGATCGTVNRSEAKSWITGNSMVIRPDPAKLDDRFLEYYLQQQDLLSSTITGAAQPQITRTSLNPIEIEFPPLSEQRRIVSVLDAAFAGLATATAHTQKNLQNARDLSDSYQHQVFNRIEGDWLKLRLGDIGKVSMCKRIFKKQTTDKGDIPFYKIGTFGKEANAFIPRHIYEEYRERFSFPKKGDVLISAAGTIGRRVQYNGEPAYFQDSNIVWIDNDETQVLNDYLYHFYGACEWNSTTGTTISRLYNDDLRRLMIAFPESKDEQLRVVQTLNDLGNEIQHMETIYQQKLVALSELKQSLLHRAFRGELSGGGSGGVLPAETVAS